MLAMERDGTIPARKMASVAARTVLIVDDTKIVQRFLEDFFRRLKFNVCVASDGIEGIRLALAAKPDVIFLDLMMPRLDGLKTLQVIKSNDSTRNVPVIVVTGYSDRINVVSAAKLGAVSVLTKPITEEMLFLKLRELYGEEFVQSVIPRDPKAKENPFGVKEDEYRDFVRSMVEEFMKFYSEQVTELETAIHSRDMETIRKITHNIRGTGGSFGFDDATTLATKLNELMHVSSVDWEEAEHILVQLKNRLKQ